MPKETVFKEKVLHPWCIILSTIISASSGLFLTLILALFGELLFGAFFGSVVFIIVFAVTSVYYYLVGGNTEFVLTDDAIQLRFNNSLANFFYLLRYSKVGIKTLRPKPLDMFSGCRVKQTSLQKKYSVGTIQLIGKRGFWTYSSIRNIEDYEKGAALINAKIQAYKPKNKKVK